MSDIKEGQVSDLLDQLDGLTLDEMQHKLLHAVLRMAGDVYHYGDPVDTEAASGRSFAEEFGTAFTSKAKLILAYDSASVVVDEGLPAPVLGTARPAMISK